MVPLRPIRVVVSTTAGSQPDMLARIIGQNMSESWAKPVVVDNRPGAQGTLAGTPVAKAAPDGHTPLYALPNFAIGAVLQPSLPYDPLRDFAGIKTVHVAFKGGPEATIEVLAGRIQYHIGTLGVLLPFIKDGRLLALAVTSPQRTPALPDVPALGETLAEFKRPETSHGFLAPAGTPHAILNRINKEVARILDLPEVRERTQSFGYVVESSTPEEYSKTLRIQIQTLTKLVQDAGLRPK